MKMCSVNLLNQAKFIKIKVCTYRKATEEESGKRKEGGRREEAGGGKEERKITCWPSLRLMIILTEIC